MVTSADPQQQPVKVAAFNAALDQLLGIDIANKIHASDTRDVEFRAKYSPSEGQRVEEAMVDVSSLPCAPLGTSEMFLIHKNNKKRERKMKLNNLFSYSCARQRTVL